MIPILYYVYHLLDGGELRREYIAADAILRMHALPSVNNDKTLIEFTTGTTMVVQGSPESNLAAFRLQFNDEYNKEG